MRIYVASSWRNRLQPSVVHELRAAGHEVYDFRHPPRGDHLGFNWSEVDPNWRSWTAEAYRKALSHPIAEAGFASDLEGMKWADACVLVMPCGRSAHLELGWVAGAGKRTYVLLDGLEPSESELMWKLADRVCLSLLELVDALE